MRSPDRRRGARVGAQVGALLNLDFLKELYFHEWERKQQLATAASLPVVILTALGSGSVFLLRSFSYRADPATLLFVAFIAASLTFQGLAVYRVIRGIRGYWYERLPDTVALRKHYKLLGEFHGTAGPPSGTAENTFDDQLAERLAGATDANRENNRRTAEFLERATSAIVGAVIFAALSFVPHFAQSLATGEVRSAWVRVANQGGAHVSKGEQQQQPAATQPSETQTPSPTQPSQTQTPSAPPTMPPNQVVPMALPQPPPMPANQEVRKGEGVREKR